ncbi:bacteriocin [Yersinia ruckeri]|uniref:bacteriocin n=1 Tax=Yersinia ruckeri TaxID=29486 RepID=UPI0008FD4E35|nr:bacteriocin [Yersinia ruckeri]EKN4689903.1 bacteriocin [Yersinia ruckeri]MCW6524301.1 bacteriocin [Yersinia ruckeri]MCW6604794.1 bacteriocin [Yersinia ruckeri]MDN0091702.1 bacteriocin [Yersinia ruckeri]OIX46824.1 bacteriocin [Yersinia ruckeri]
MGYGLIDIANQTRQQAMDALSDVAHRETQRESTNRQLKAQQKQGLMSMIGVGAGTGMAVGATYGTAGGPIGMGIGAAIGLLASRLF